MKQLQILLLISLLFTFTTAEQSCLDNPVLPRFTEFLQLYAQDNDQILQALDSYSQQTPEIQEDLSYCSQFNGQNTCCTPELLNTFENAFIAYFNKESVKRNQIGFLLENFQSAFSQCFDQELDQSAQEILQNLNQYYWIAQGRVLRSQMRFQRGNVCGLCVDPENWEQYFSEQVLVINRQSYFEYISEIEQNLQFISTANTQFSQFVQNNEQLFEQGQCAQLQSKIQQVLEQISIQTECEYTNDTQLFGNGCIQDLFADSVLEEQNILNIEYVQQQSENDEQSEEQDEQNNSEQQQNEDDEQSQQQAEQSEQEVEQSEQQSEQQVEQSEQEQQVEQSESEQQVEQSEQEQQVEESEQQVEQSEYEQQVEQSEQEQQQSEQDDDDDDDDDSEECDTEGGLYECVTETESEQQQVEQESEQNENSDSEEEECDTENGQYECVTETESESEQQQIQEESEQQQVEEESESESEECISDEEYECVSEEEEEEQTRRMLKKTKKRVQKVQQEEVQEVQEEQQQNQEQAPKKTKKVKRKRQEKDLEEQITDAPTLIEEEEQEEPKKKSKKVRKVRKQVQVEEEQEQKEQPAKKKKKKVKSSSQKKRRNLVESQFVLSLEGEEEQQQGLITFIANEQTEEQLAINGILINQELPELNVQKINNNNQGNQKELENSGNSGTYTILLFIALLLSVGGWFGYQKYQQNLHQQKITYALDDFDSSRSGKQFTEEISFEPQQSELEKPKKKKTAKKSREARAGGLEDEDSLELSLIPGAKFSRQEMVEFS